MQTAEVCSELRGAGLSAVHTPDWSCRHGGGVRWRASAGPHQGCQRSPRRPLRAEDCPQGAQTRAAVLWGLAHTAWLKSTRSPLQARRRIITSEPRWVQSPDTDRAQGQRGLTLPLSRGHWLRLLLPGQHPIVVTGVGGAPAVGVGPSHSRSAWRMFSVTPAGLWGAWPRAEGMFLAVSVHVRSAITASLRAAEHCRSTRVRVRSLQ